MGKSHSTILIHAKAYFHIVVWSRSHFCFIGLACVQNTQSGEISATLAETECSVSLVRVQCKGSFLVFLMFRSSV